MEHWAIGIVMERILWCANYDANKCTLKYFNGFTVCSINKKFVESPLTDICEIHGEEMVTFPNILTSLTSQIIRYHQKFTADTIISTNHYYMCVRTNLIQYTALAWIIRSLMRRGGMMLFTKKMCKEILIRRFTRRSRRFNQFEFVVFQTLFELKEWVSECTLT